MTRNSGTRSGVPEGGSALGGSRRAWQVVALVGVVVAAGLAVGVRIPDPVEPVGWALNRGFESFANEFDCGFRADQSMQCRSGRTLSERWFVALDGI